MIDGYDTAALVTAALITFGGAAAILAWGWWAPIAGRVERWAAARRVPLTDESEPYVSRRMRAARRWRCTGVAIAWTLPFGWQVLHRSAYARIDGWVVPGLALALYLAGAVAAEVIAARRLPTGGAAVDQREVTAYLPASLLRWPTRLAAASVVLAGSAWLAGPVDDGRSLPAALQAGLAVVSVAVVAPSRWLPRYIVSRRQPFVSSALIRADDGLRSWSAHACVAAVLSAQLLVISQQASGLAHQLATPSRWVLLALALASLAIAIGVVQVVSGPDWRWTVRRDLPSGAGG